MMSYFIRLFLIAFFIVPALGANLPAADPAVCKQTGEAPDCIGPGVSNGEQCCLGLSAREQKEACGQPYGGCASVCVACGDGLCDAEHENGCNCPEDCGGP